MNDAQVGLSEELFLKCTSVWTTDEDINTTQLKRVMKNQYIKRQFFQNLDNFYISMFLVNGENVLLLDFVNYPLSKLYSNCT